MGRRLLPCPVCGGESFIESVTQGGLICTDCGAVSNQVEVADDEMDPSAGPKTFTRGTSYRHVTEEESQAKRDRKITLSLADRRDVPFLLEGLGMIVAHMAEACASLDVCAGDVREWVKETWFEFLGLVSVSTDSPQVMGKRLATRLAVNMAKWGIVNDFTEAVTRDLPTERLKRIQALHQLMQERRLGSVRDMYHDSPFLIFAHDWLCLLFQTNEFPFPDWILVHFSGQPVSFPEIQRMQALTPHTPRSTSLSKADRNVFMRKLFVDIVSSDEIRHSVRGDSAGNSSSATVPAIDYPSILALLIVAIRRAGGAAEPTHIINWIARSQIPYFSAHKCLPLSVDRIEYYRIPRTAHAYRKSIFAPTSAVPTAKDLGDLLEALSTLGMDVGRNDPMALLRTGIDMLGLRPLLPLAEGVLAVALERVVKGRGGRTFKWRPHKRSLKPENEDFILADVLEEEFVLYSILVAMKLVFPDLHTRVTQTLAPGVVPHDLVAECVHAGAEYTVMSGRSFGPVGDIDWWNAMTRSEKDQFLRYVEFEHLNELREGIVDDIRAMLVPGTAGSTSEASATILRTGEVKVYTVTPVELSPYSLQHRVIEDVKFALQLDSRRCLVRGLRYFERFLFRRDSRVEVLGTAQLLSS